MGICGRFMEVTPGEGSAHQPTIPIAVLSPRNSHMPKANLCTVHLCLKAGRFRPSPKRLFDLKRRFGLGRKRPALRHRWTVQRLALGMWELRGDKTAMGIVG